MAHHHHENTSFLSWNCSEADDDGGNDVTGDVVAADNDPCIP
jgi:hypothetical protein